MPPRKNPNDSILVMGIRLHENTVYEVGAKKPSEGAPDIYKKLGSEKASAPRGVVANVVGFPFINGMWDTGLYEHSPIYKGEDLDKVKEQVKANRAFIIEPLKKAGLKVLAEQLDEYENPESKFFNSDIQVPLSMGTQFNTGDAKSRLALYAAIISGELAPQGKANKEERESGVRDESDSLYMHAQYTINSQTLTRSVKEQREYDNNRARGIFFNLMENNKEGLISIMNYEGISSSVSDPDRALNQVINKYFESQDNIESFIETYERYKNDEKFKDELSIMSILVNEKGLKVLEKDGRNYMLKGKDLGTTVKTVARTISESPQLTNEFFKLTTK